MTQSNLLSICGADELDSLGSAGITHIVSISNPGTTPSLPGWFAGNHLPLCFGDVVSEKDAAACHTKAATLEDVRRAVGFTRNAWAHASAHVLVFCDYGASRSPAVAYVSLAAAIGPGREAQALERVIGIRDCAIPNKLVVALGDSLLDRNGALLAPLWRLYRKINEDL